MEKKIISIGAKELSEYEIKELDDVEFDLAVYSYESGSYDGSGFAVFKKGDMWFYHEMGHCSCYGPLSEVYSSKNMLVSFEDMEKIAEKGYNDHAKNVIKYIKENNLV
jgi:hypothetical protein